MFKNRYFDLNPLQCNKLYKSQIFIKRVIKKQLWFIQSHLFTFSKNRKVLKRNESYPKRTAAPKTT